MTTQTLPTTVEGYELANAGNGVILTRELAAPGLGQVIISVLMTGVCASELYDWKQPPERHVPVGHEPVGEVVAIGAGVDLRVGEWVTGRVLRAFAPFIVADAVDLVTVPAGLRRSDVLGEPVGCVVEGLRRTRVDDGARIAVIGTGFMGLVMVQLLAHSLTESVTAIDPREDARIAAIQNGADDTSGPDDLAGVVDEFDVVIEATGVQAGIDLATALVRPHGTLSVLGYHRTPRTVDMQQWNYKAIDVVNAHVQDHRLLRDAVRVGVELAAAGRIDPGRLITHRFGPDRIDEAFQTLSDKPEGFIKAVIDYRAE